MPKRTQKSEYTKEFKPNGGDKNGHCVMSCSPHIPIVVHHKPFVFKSLQKKELRKSQKSETSVSKLMTSKCVIIKNLRKGD